MRQNLLATAEGNLGSQNFVGGDATLLAYPRGDQATPQISFLSLSFNFYKPFLSFDETSFKTIDTREWFVPEWFAQILELSEADAGAAQEKTT